MLSARSFLQEIQRNFLLLNLQLALKKNMDVVGTALVLIWSWTSVREVNTSNPAYPSTANFSSLLLPNPRWSHEL